MQMAFYPLSASAAFLVGAAGSVHCLAMCGGISGALGLRARTLRGAASPLLPAIAHQVGRAMSYSLAGAVVGGVGGMFESLLHLDALALGARIMAGLVLILVALGILLKRRPLMPIERLGGRFWMRLAPLARKVPAGLSGALLLGALWGFLPCGFVYSMLIFAALTGSAWQGAIMMLCFGAGTAPAVLGAGLLSARLARFMSVRRLYGAAGWLLLVFGALTILGPLAMGPLAMGSLGHMHH